jgi:hypothetical protein
MGRRGRVRARQGAGAAANAKPASGWRAALGERGSRRRALVGAAGFGIVAGFCGVVALVSGYPPWRATAVLFGVLTVLWAGKAALMRDE